MQPITQEVLQELYARAKQQNNSEWECIEPQLRAIWSTQIDKFEVKSHAVMRQEVESSIIKIVKEKYNLGCFTIKACNNKLKNNLKLDSFPNAKELESLHQKKIDKLVLDMATDRFESWRSKRFPTAKFVVQKINGAERTLFLEFQLKV
jgi:hypothetical protein